MITQGKHSVPNQPQKTPHQVPNHPSGHGGGHQKSVRKPTRAHHPTHPKKPASQHKSAPRFVLPDLFTFLIPPPLSGLPN